MTAERERDAQHMKRALGLAARAAGNTSPNPMVGAVVVDVRGHVAGEGYHERAGSPHAEAVALERAGEAAQGGTLYVTLEPCVHQGRTPPCIDAVLASGVKRVVIAARDEDERMRGAGVRALEQAGIEVEVGVGASDAYRLNRAYIHHRRAGTPFITLKMAQSIDGAVAQHAGERQQLTGRAASQHVRSLRFEHDAVMIGVGTALSDDPLLTVRPFKKRAVPYVRVIVDSTARLPTTSRLLADTGRAATVVAASVEAPSDKVAALEAAGAEVMICRSDPDGRIDLADLLERLGRRGIISIVCEGGPALAGALLAGGFVQELHWLIAPVFLGSAHRAPVLSGLRQPLDAGLQAVRRLGDDVLIVAIPKTRMP